VLSYPGPDRSVRLEDLRAGRALPRRYRNRRIGEFLKELDMTEGRATGIPKILHAMQENGSPPPVFDFDEDHAFFMCRLPVHPQATMPEALTEQAGPGTGAVATPQVTPQVAPQVKRLLRECDGERLRDELQQRAGIADRKYFRTSFLRPALDAGLLEMTIPDKPNSRFQKYRLTDQGRAWLKK